MALLDTLKELGEEVTGEDAYKSIIEGINDLNGLKDFLNSHKEKNPLLHQLVEEKIGALAKNMKTEDAAALKDLMELGFVLAGDILKNGGQKNRQEVPLPAILNKGKAKEDNESKENKNGNVSKVVSDALKQAAGGR